MNVKEVDRSIEHAAYDEWVRDDSDGNPIYRTIECGEWVAGRGNVFCDECEEELAERYPQSWSYYPGDICPHGMYTGGSGIDWMCHLCEMGMTQWYDDPHYMLRMAIGESASVPVHTVRQWYASELETEMGRAHVEKAIYDFAVSLFMGLELNDPDGSVTRGLTFHVVAESQGYWDEPTYD